MNLKGALITKGNEIAKFFNKSQKYTVATVAGTNCSAEGFDTVEQACSTGLTNLSDLMESWAKERPNAELELQVTLRESGKADVVSLKFPAPQKYMIAAAQGN